MSDPNLSITRGEAERLRVQVDRLRKLLELAPGFEYAPDADAGSSGRARCGIDEQGARIEEITNPAAESGVALFDPSWPEGRRTGARDGRVPDAFEIAGWSEPADQMGGDHFDWLLRGEGGVAGAMVDVSGSGLVPAIVTAMCRVQARALLLDEEPLDLVLRGLDALLSEEVPSTCVVTFAAAQLDADSGVVEVIAAARGPYYVYRGADEILERIDAHTLPLASGSVIEAFASTRHELAAGDALVVLSDAFRTWSDANGEPFGLARLESSIARHIPSCSAEDALVSLHEEVQRHAGERMQREDMTGVLIRRREGF